VQRLRQSPAAGDRDETEDAEERYAQSAEL
jgi:hypothetical protein